MLQYKNIPELYFAQRIVSYCNKENITYEWKTIQKDHGSMAFEFQESKNPEGQLALWFDSYLNDISL